MKKFLCSFISVLLVITSSSLVFAKGKETKASSQQLNNIYEKGQADSSFDSNVNNKGQNNYNSTKKDSVKEAAKEVKQGPKDALKTKKDQIKEKVKKQVQEKKNKNDNSLPVFIKDKEVKFDVPPVIKSGRTLIPVRAITNALGADVEWDEKTKTVTVSKAVYDAVYGVSTTIVTLKLDSNIILINGKEVEIDVPAQLVSNRTMVPLRFIAQALNNEIEYDTETGAIIVGEDEDEDIDVDCQLEAFMVELKNKHKDKHARKAIIKKISELKKKKNVSAILVFVKGSEINFDVPPVIKAGRTLIPVRAVSDALGADVKWNEETKTITITKSVYGEKDTIVEINLNSDIVLVNGKKEKIDVPAQSINNRTMVPLRFIAVILNQDVEYYSETGTIIIEDTDSKEDVDNNEKVIVDDDN